MNQKGYVIVDDEFVPIDEFKIDIAEGLLYGYGVFETFLVKNGKIQYVEEHYSRLVRSTIQIELKFEMKYEKIKFLLELYLKKNSINDGVLRLTVFKNGEKSNFLITHRENPYKRSQYREGFKVEISEFRRNPNSLLSNVKTTNFLENIYVLREAQRVGSDEVLFLDTQKYIAEGATTNIFFVKDGVIYTPTKECGLLEGIIRNKLIEIIEENKFLQIKQGFFRLNKLLEADEVFLTNSVLGIMPVSKIDHTKYDLSKFHVTDLLIEELERLEK